jgi:hypothetical protein
MAKMKKKFTFIMKHTFPLKRTLMQLNHILPPAGFFLSLGAALPFADAIVDNLTNGTNDNMFGNEMYYYDEHGGNLVINGAHTARDTQ